jgi:hypothetical protein
MKIGDVVIPDPETADFAELAAWYSGFAYAEHYRKVVLSACREVIRAGASLTNQKLTESRMEDLSRVHPSYLDFLARHLQGRMAWEQEHMKQGFGS